MMSSYEVCLESGRHKQVSDACQSWFKTLKGHDLGSQEWRKGRDLTQLYDKSPYTDRKIQKAT